MSEENKPQVDVRDLKPNKDAKGGHGHGGNSGHTTGHGPHKQQQ